MAGAGKVLVAAPKVTAVFVFSPKGNDFEAPNWFVVGLLLVWVLFIVPKDVGFVVAGADPNVKAAFDPNAGWEFAPNAV